MHYLRMSLCVKMWTCSGYDKWGLSLQTENSNAIMFENDCSILADLPIQHYWNVDLTDGTISHTLKMKINLAE